MQGVILGGWVEAGRRRAGPRVACLLVLVGAAVAEPLAVATDPAEATYPGRNGMIVFTLSRYNLGTYGDRLLAVSPGTGRRIPLEVCRSKGYGRSTCHDHDPSFSPDGRRLFFVSGRGGDDLDPPNSALVVARPDGSVLRTLRKPWYEGGPVSPGGDRLLFASRRRGMATVGVADGRLRQLNRVPGSFRDLDWSSLNRIVYVRRFDLYAVDPDGRRPRRLTRFGRFDSSLASPSWSPGGRKIAFQRSSPGGGSGSTIWTMNSDGSNKRRIARGGHPVWSPDGRRIAFARGGGYSGTELFVAQPDGTRVRRVVRVESEGFDQYDIFEPAWQPLPRHR